MKRMTWLAVLFALFSGRVTMAFAETPVDNLKALAGLLPAGAQITQVTVYDIRGVGQKDSIVYYQLPGQGCAVALVSKEMKTLWSFQENGADHIWMPASALPGVAFLDAAHPAVPYLVFNPYFNAAKSQFHVFRWNGKGFLEMSHGDLGNNPQVSQMTDGVPAVVADNFGYPTPHLFVLKNDSLVPADYQYPRFFDETVKQAQQSLHDIQMIPHPDYLEVESKFVSAFLYAHQCQEGLKFADQLLSLQPTGLGSDLTSKAVVEIHHEKGCLYMELGKEAEGMAEFKVASSLDERAQYQGRAGVYAQLGDYYQGKNDGTRAVAAYETAQSFLGNGKVRVAEGLNGHIQKLSQSEGVAQDSMEVSEAATIDLSAEVSKTLVVSSLP
jgi:hypothetical protein